MTELQTELFCLLKWCRGTEVALEIGLPRWENCTGKRWSERYPWGKGYGKPGTGTRNQEGWGSTWSWDGLTPGVQYAHEDKAALSRGPQLVIISKSLGITLWVGTSEATQTTQIFRARPGAICSWQGAQQCILAAQESSGPFEEVAGDPTDSGMLGALS